MYMRISQLQQNILNLSLSQDANVFWVALYNVVWSGDCLWPPGSWGLPSYIQPHFRNDNLCHFHPDPHQNFNGQTNTSVHTNKAFAHQHYLHTSTTLHTAEVDLHLKSTKGWSRIKVGVRRSPRWCFIMFVLWHQFFVLVSFYLVISSWKLRNLY